MLATIPCPTCKVRLQTPNSLLGKTIHCPKCMKPVKLVVRNGSAAPTMKPPAPSLESPDQKPDIVPPASMEDDDFMAGLEPVDDVDLDALTSAAEAEAAVKKEPAEEKEAMMEETVEEDAIEEDAVEAPVEEPAVEEAAAEEAAIEEPIEEEAVEEKAAEEEAIEAAAVEETAVDEEAVKEEAVEESVEEEAVEEEAVEEEAVEEEAVKEEAVEEEAVEEEAVEEPVEEETLEGPVEEETAEKSNKKKAPKKGAKAAVEEEAAEEEEPAELPAAVEKFLSANLFLIKGASGLFSMSAAWDFLNPKTKAKIGTAVERPEGIMQALRFFLRRNWLPSKIEVREEKTNELIFTVKRPAYFFNCTLEVRDPDNKLLAKFTYKTFSRMLAKPMPIERKGGVKFGTCEFYFLKGRVDLMDDDKKELANMQTESAYTKAIKIYWAARGGSYYVTFNKPLFDKPLDKMIFLGVTLAMDLMQEDAKASNNKGAGISIGS